MSPRRLTAPVLLLLLVAAPLGAGPFGTRRALVRTNRKLHGQVVDYTYNHGADRRLFSHALGCPRDLYVYLPPCFDPTQQYPLVLWLHGFAQDELSFLHDVIPSLDEAIACGKLPPVIIAAPDGSLTGRAYYNSAGSFFLNSKAGNYEDYVMGEVWDFVHRTYPIRPEREAHVLAGVSMGGGAAYHHGIKYRDRVKIALSIFPPLNTRWIDCTGRYRGDFDPHCWDWRTDFSPSHEVVARFYGFFTVRLGQLVKPLYGEGPQVAYEISRDNPAEMLHTYGLRPGELSMYVAWGGLDQFNLDAQIESFLFLAHHRGLDVHTDYLPRGKHDAPTARKFIPGAIDWLAPQIAPYSPPLPH